MLKKKKSPANAQCTGLVPGLERLPAQRLSPAAATEASSLEPELHERSHHNEAETARSRRAALFGVATRESPMCSNKDPGEAKINK